MVDVSGLDGGASPAPGAEWGPGPTSGAGYDSSRPTPWAWEAVLGYYGIRHDWCVSLM